MAHKKTKNELSNMADDSLKKSDKMQTFVRDFRNAVETRVRSMEDALAQNILKIESHFDLKKSQIPQEILQMRFVDYIELEGKKPSKKNKDKDADDDVAKTRTTKKKTRGAPATARVKQTLTKTSRRGKASTKAPVEADDEDIKTVDADPGACNIIDVLCKENIDLEAFNVPPELTERFLENMKRLQEKAGKEKK